VQQPSTHIHHLQARLLLIDVINNLSQFNLKRPLSGAHFLEIRAFTDGNLVQFNELRFKNAMILAIAI
jgi:hypothetical protein